MRNGGKITRRTFCNLESLAKNFNLGTLVLGVHQNDHLTFQNHKNINLRARLPRLQNEQGSRQVKDR